ncbi:polysaccharide biosynthesis protein [Candidatus Wolfebacteria bacterium]|nr:polysaccharide biosynthesis protein [Candidatus Wolfebacteria bacterium]
MNYKDKFKNKTIMVTGGTGSFGNAVVKKLLQYSPKKIVIFSRDEKKQFDMGNEYDNDKIRFVIGDIRDRNAIFQAMYGVDYVFHAAALKQVPQCEFFPWEAIKTNSIGANNVIDMAILQKVKRVVILSTDKAVYPINVMGMTKALMERIMIAISREKRDKTVLCGTRYGNVMYTRGSVIPYFIELMKAGKPLTITNKKMTRFMMSLEQSVDLVLYALTEGKNGEIYVRKSSAATVGDLAQVLIEIFDYKKDIQEIGARPGEKLHETLISSEEVVRTDDCGDYYKIRPEVPGMDFRQYYFKGKKNNTLLNEGYTSENTKRLSKNELKKLLLSLEEIKKELKNLKK